MKPSEIGAADARARQLWTAKPDAPGKDHWHSFHDRVATGEAFSGDCDDLATTVMQLLCESGLNIRDGWFLLVDSNGDMRGDHLVGGAKDEFDGFWVIGDTLAEGIYPAHTMKHKGVAYFRLSEMKLRDGLPWERVN